MSLTPKCNTQNHAPCQWSDWKGGKAGQREGEGRVKEDEERVKGEDEGGGEALLPNETPKTMLHINGLIGRFVLSAILSRAGTNNAAKAMPLKIPENKADSQRMKVIAAMSRFP